MTEALPYSSPSLARPQRPIIELLGLALPTVAQMASYTLMQFIDTSMLARVGNGIDAPTAGANGGMLAFSLISLGMGVLFVVNTLASQSFGRRDYAECGRFLWQGIWFGLAFSILLIPVIPLASASFRWMGHEPALQRLETSYLRILLATASIKLVATALGQFLLAIDRPNSVLVCAVAAVSVNIVAAWVLIFGHWGMPAMGVVGAAWAQNIGVSVEMLTLIGFVCQRSVRRRFGVHDWRPRLAQLRTLLKVGIPSGVQVVSEVLAWTAFAVWVMAAFRGAAGTRAMAATTFIFRYLSVSFMPIYGISVAVTALVGRYIGMRRPDLARQRTHLAFAVAAIYTLVCGVLFLTARHDLIRLFARDPQVIQTGATLLIFAAVYQFFDALYIIYNGALRGAGDTLVPAILTALLCWGITVLGGRAMAQVRPQLGPVGPWFVALAYGIILGVFVYARFVRGKWQSIHLEEAGGADRVRPIVVQAFQPASSRVGTAHQAQSE